MDEVILIRLLILLPILLPILLLIRRPFLLLIPPYPAPCPDLSTSHDFSRTVLLMDT